jgi:hypothetical protein
MVFFYLLTGKKPKKEDRKPDSYLIPKAPTRGGAVAKSSQSTSQYVLQAGLWIRIRIRINLSCWIRIQECKNDLQMYKKVKNFHVLKFWMFFFEG